jgi:hypothetical protein
MARREDSGPQLEEFLTRILRTLSREQAAPKEQARWGLRVDVAETNRARFTLFGVQNRAFGPYLMANIWIPISDM